MSCQCQCSPGVGEYAPVDQIIEKYSGQKGALISILHDVQEVYGYLSEETQAYVAQKLNVPLSEIYGVVSFYAFFTTVPQGKYKISICMGTACYVKGAGAIVDEFEKQLGVKVGNTTPDGLFTLEACRCLGACGLAPVLMVNGSVHGRLVPKDVPDIIKKYKEQL